MTAAEYFTIELVAPGHPQDGRTLKVAEDILKSGALVMPEAQPLSLADAVDNGLSGTATFSQTRYQWDGTVREDGVRPFHRVTPS